jgi:hypothetical protein
MARGWESKSVEAQMEAAAESAAAGNKPSASIEDTRRAQRKRALELSRSRVLSSLEKSENPRYRKMLEQALASLDAELSKLGS